MMIEVTIVSEDSLEDIISALKPHGIDVINHYQPPNSTGSIFIALVPDSHDAVDEVTDALNDNGLSGWVEIEEE